MSNTPSDTFGPYSDMVIDQSDPAHIEFYETFGRMDVADHNVPTPDVDVPVSPTPATHNDQAQTVNTTQQIGATHPSIADSNAPPIEVQISLAAHAAILGMTEEELAQILATDPDASEQEIDHNLTHAPPLVPLVQNPDYWNPEEVQEHDRGNGTIDPRLLMLWPSNETTTRTPYRLTTVTPDLTITEPELSPRALRALRRARRQEGSRQ